eukprot:scaffold11555_cov63-Phaeocystis_antarctica.AAC.5
MQIAAHQLSVSDTHLQLQLVQLVEHCKHREGDDNRDDQRQPVAMQPARGSPHPHATDVAKHLQLHPREANPGKRDAQQRSKEHCPHDAPLFSEYGCGPDECTGRAV